MQYSHHIQYPSNWEQPAFALGGLIMVDQTPYICVGISYVQQADQYREKGWYYEYVLPNGDDRISSHESEVSAVVLMH